MQSRLFFGSAAGIARVSDFTFPLLSQSLVPLQCENHLVTAPPACGNVPSLVAAVIPATSRDGSQFRGARAQATVICQLRFSQR